MERRLNRDAAFAISLSQATTASLGTDFMVDLPLNITIGANTTAFRECFNTVIAEDNLAEYDEVIDYLVTPLNDLDQVMFTTNTPSLLITIEDDDGKYYNNIQNCIKIAIVQ